MESAASNLIKTAPAGAAAGYLSNAGTQRYLLEAESTTGFVAWKLADGTTLVSNTMEVSIAASPSICFWACAGYEDTTPAGSIVYFDCHGNALAQLDVTAMTSLEYLDASFNNLRELDLRGLSALQAVDVDDNQLATLAVNDLHNLRVLNCSCNRLQELDLTGLTQLQILDCSSNQIASLRCEGCTSLQDSRRDRNPLRA